MRKVYLAARYTRQAELREYAATLVAKGFEVTSRWLTAPHESYPDGTLLDSRPLWAEWADHDLRDILRADIFILFAETYGTAWPHGGRHVEMGYALGTGKEVWLIGEPENIFGCHDRVRLYASWEAFLGAAAADPFISTAQSRP